jgi:hypothetical protein
MVSRAPRRRWDHPFEPQGRQIELLYKDLDRPHRILVGDVVFQAVRQQRLLHPLLAPNEPIHLHPPEAPGASRF